MDDKKQGIKILEQIGAGGFGKVYKCTHWGTTRVVKKVPISKGTQTFRTVMSEFMVLSQVKHPRIVSLVTFYQTNTDWNFVLEYMSNGSLRDLLDMFIEKKWKFRESDLIGMFMDVVIAVKYLHSKGIIHRDLKPENILLDENHRTKIADFGIAKLICSNMAEYHTAVGTMLYMAPEVYLHLPYDKGIDTWALGLIFYEMAMLKYPFSQADKARIMNSGLSFIVPKIDCIRRNYSPQFQDVLNVMLQRDPKKRADLHFICRFTLFDKIYQQVRNEELQALSKPR